MTHSARSDIAASVTSARDGLTVRASVSEHLGGPDDRYLGGFAGPQDLLLDLGEAVETDLDRQVTTSDHHADVVPTHHRQQLRQSLEGGDVLDLQDDADLSSAEPVELPSELLDVLGVGDEHDVDDVCVASHERKILEILGSQRIELQIGVRQVDPLAGFQLCAARADIGDRQRDLVASDAIGGAADLAVVKPDPLPGPDVLNRLGRLEPM
jgi:hypothetical protein